MGTEENLKLKQESSTSKRKSFISTIKTLSPVFSFLSSLLSFALGIIALSIAWKGDADKKEALEALKKMTEASMNQSDTFRKALEEMRSQTASFQEQINQLSKTNTIIYEELKASEKRNQIMIKNMNSQQVSSQKRDSLIMKNHSDNLKNFEKEFILNSENIRKSNKRLEKEIERNTLTNKVLNSPQLIFDISGVPGSRKNNDLSLLVTNVGNGLAIIDSVICSIDSIVIKDKNVKETYDSLIQIQTFSIDKNYIYSLMNPGALAPGEKHNFIKILANNVSLGYSIKWQKRVDRIGIVIFYRSVFGHQFKAVKPPYPDKSTPTFNLTPRDSI